MPIATKQRRKQVFIVDDHPVFTDGVATLINHTTDLQVCGTATNCAQALKEIRRLKPDVLVVDIGLPDKSGLELTREVAALKQPVPVLVVSAGDEMVHARAALKAGARGYVMKNEPPERLLQAVRQVLGNSTSVSAPVANQILQSMQKRRGACDVMDLLSVREREVFTLIGDGLTTPKIAQQLKITCKTVDAYRANIRHKLGVADAHELLYSAVRWRTASDRTRAAK